MHRLVLVLTDWVHSMNRFTQAGDAEQSRRVMRRAHSPHDCTRVYRHVLTEIERATNQDLQIYRPRCRSHDRYKTSAAFLVVIMKVVWVDDKV